MFKLFLNNTSAYTLRTNSSKFGTSSKALLSLLTKQSTTTTKSQTLKYYSTKKPSNTKMSYEKAESVKITLPNGLEYEQPIGLFINGEFVKPLKENSKPDLVTENPATGEALATIYTATPQDVENCISSTYDLFEKGSPISDESAEQWKNLDPRIRTEYLYKIGDYIEKNLDLIASIECADNGKAFALAKGDVQLAAQYFKSVSSMSSMNGRVVETGDKYMNYTLREPVGVCAAIIPFNFPFLIMVWKLCPALFAGNHMIIKPASTTPLSALYFGKICQEVGIPKGVVSVLAGSGRVVGDAMSTSEKIHKLSFTGSTGVGKSVATKATESNLKKVTMELGGKSGHIVFADAIRSKNPKDINSTMENICNGIFKNAGQICSSGSRVYVQDEVYELFLSEFKKYIESTIKIGNPFNKENYQGAINNKSQYNTILNYIDIGKDEGAKILTGGKALTKTSQGEETKGYFVEPTVFYDVNEEMRIVKEEIFGPVVSISKFSTANDVIAMVNNSEFGLGAGIQTKDLNTALKVSKKLQAGTVWINTYNDFDIGVPFGGFKQSGYGKEMGVEALEAYTHVKAVRIKLDDN